MLFKIIGVIGVLFITYGIYVKNEIKQDLVFILGGGCLLVYSIYLWDPIFIPLQIIFIIGSLVEIIKIKRKK